MRAMLVACSMSFSAPVVRLPLFALAPPHVKELKSIPLFFVSKETRVPWTHGGLQNDIYRPLQSTSFAISYALWGENPGAFHKENVFLHLVNGVLLYFLLRLLLNSARMGFLAALLFLVHPVQVEAVTYLVERASVLSLTFFLAAFHLIVQSCLHDLGRFR